MTNAWPQRPVECECGRGYVRSDEPEPRCHWCGVDDLASTSRLARHVLEADWPEMPDEAIDAGCAALADAVSATDEQR